MSTPAPDSAGHPPPRGIALAETTLVVATGVVALLYFGVFGYLVAHHLGYPFELEWMEGSMADHAHRALRGQQIYVEPSIEFAPHGYPFVYPYAAAALMSVMGAGFLPMRLLSATASVTSFVLIFLLVRRETGGGYAGLIAAGVGAAGYEIGGCFFDVARVDALHVALVLASIYLVRFAKLRTTALLAGAVLGLSFLTKQTSLVFAPGFALYLLLFRRRHFLPFTVGLLGIAVGGTLLFDRFTDGWYSFYTLSFQVGRTVQWGILPLFLKKDLAPMMIALAFGLLFLLSRVSWRRDLDAGAFYLLIAGAIIGGCGISRSLSLGAFNNVLIPVYAVLSIGMGLGLREALRCVQDAAGDGRWRALLPFVLLLVLVQLGTLAFDPRPRVPTEADRAAGERFIDWARNIDGEVWLVGQGFLPTYADRPSHIHTVGIIDSASNPRTEPSVRRSVVAALKQRRFAAIVTSHPWDGDPRTWFLETLLENYTDAGPFFDDPLVFRPITGVRLRPARLYLRKP